jgi:hypothetical protein
MISTTINIQNFGDGKIDFAESLLNNSIRFLAFLNKWLGLIGESIVIIPIFPFFALFQFLFTLYMQNLAKTMSKTKGVLLNEISTYSFDQVKSMEDSILPIEKKLNDLRKSLKSLSLESNILFTPTYIAVSSISSDFEAINQALQNRYTYSKDELSTEQLQSVTDYWNNFQKKNPEVFKILAADKSGEEVVFNSKKRK